MLRWWRKGPCVTVAEAGRSPGRRRRLRHELDPPAGRRRRPRRRTGRAGPPDDDRPARPGRRPHRRLRPRGAGAHLRRLPEYAAVIKRHGAERTPVRRHLRLPGRREPRRVRARRRGHPRRRARGDHRRPGGRVLLHAAPPRSCGRDLPGPYLVVDIGGGSTEFVVGDATRCVAAASVDIGCVRMTERHLDASDPPTAARSPPSADIEAALDRRRPSRCARPARWSASPAP